MHRKIFVKLYRIMFSFPLDDYDHETLGLVDLSFQGNLTFQKDFPPLCDDFSGNILHQLLFKFLENIPGRGAGGTTA